MINVRRLAAVDLTYLGPWIVLPEFALGVCGPPALGWLTLARGRSTGRWLVGLYLLSLGVNYVPLLLYAWRFARTRTAPLEIADESGDTRTMFRKYRRQSLLLLVPLVVPLAALADEWRRRRT